MTGAPALCWGSLFTVYCWRYIISPLHLNSSARIIVSFLPILTLRSSRHGTYRHDDLPAASTFRKFSNNSFKLSKRGYWKKSLNLIMKTLWLANNLKFWNKSLFSLVSYNAMCFCLTNSRKLHEKAKILVSLSYMAGKKSEICRQIHEVSQAEMQERKQLRFSWQNCNRFWETITGDSHEWQHLWLPSYRRKGGSQNYAENPTSNRHKIQ